MYLCQNQTKMLDIIYFVLCALLYCTKPTKIKLTTYDKVNFRPVTMLILMLSSDDMDNDSQPSTDLDVSKYDCIFNFQRIGQIVYPEDVRVQNSSGSKSTQRIALPFDSYVLLSPYPAKDCILSSHRVSIRTKIKDSTQHENL